MPRSLANLGLPPEELSRHIAWDIGVDALGQRLADLLSACFISQRFSRLVIDCNRDPTRADAICEVSDGTVVPGNAALDPAQRRQRVAEVFEPYHARIAEALDDQISRGARPILVALHSFTPVMGGAPRPWRYGVLHLGHSAASQAALAALRARLPADEVGDNQPYQMDGTDFTAPFHAIRRGLDYVELEVRQDLIGEPAGVEAAAGLLAAVLRSL